MKNAVWKKTTERCTRGRTSYGQFTGFIQAYPFLWLLKQSSRKNSHKTDYNATIIPVSNNSASSVSEVRLSLSPLILFSAFVASQHSLKERWPFSLTTTTESSFWAAGSTQTHTLWGLIEILQGLDHLQKGNTRADTAQRCVETPMKENPSAEVGSKKRNRARARGGNWQIPSWQGSWWPNSRYSHLTSVSPVLPLYWVFLIS